MLNPVKITIGQKVIQTFFSYGAVNDFHLNEMKIIYCVIKTSQLILYTEIIAFCSQIHTKHINALYGQNVDLLNVNPGGTYSDHWTLEG